MSLPLKYHHIGIPTDIPRDGEEYLEEYDVYTHGYGENPYRTEWMRFGPRCPLPELVKTVPHVAFEVDDLQTDLVGKEILIEPNSPSPGVMVAFIVDNGVPIEFLQVEHPEQAPRLFSPAAEQSGHPRQNRRN